MKKLSIVVPYRNREQHLAQFIPFMEEYLKHLSNGKDYESRIVIVEQDDEKPFNRGKLLNIGFAESKDCDYFCFHDVDMLPVNSDYSPVDSPTHMAAEAEQFGWKLPYDGYFGGVTMFDKESFEKINGYANEYWGWGAEDDDILTRCSIMKVPTFRKPGRYRSLAHERVISNDLYTKNLDKLHLFQMKSTEERVMKDGLTTLSYEKSDEEKIGEISVKIKVKI
jgi:predicted glycosyltransferase involved in capsule biosynthesis